jgi:hypothetical protein
MFGVKLMQDVLLGFYGGFESELIFPLFFFDLSCRLIFAILIAIFA